MFHGQVWPVDPEVCSGDMAATQSVRSIGRFGNGRKPLADCRRPTRSIESESSDAAEPSQSSIGLPARKQLVSKPAHRPSSSNFCPVCLLCLWPSIELTDSPRTGSPLQYQAIPTQSIQTQVSIMADALPPPVPIQLLEPTTAFVATTWSLSVVVLLAFAGTAVFLARKHLRSHASEFDTEQFITARATQPWMRIGWSFFTGGLGAWAIATPANYASFAGVLGLVAYALSTGIPILLIAFAGIKVQKLLPKPLSLSDFVLWRYGRVTQVFVAVVCIFNMSMAIISEYSTIGSIFLQFVKTSQYPIILLVFFLTASYTAYGGLIISIITDQFQGIFATALVVTLIAFISATFPGMQLPTFPVETLGPQYYGWTSLMTLPTSLIAATFFSEAMWQRIWAAESQTALRKGAVFGCIMLIVTVGIFGLCGLLAAWAYSPSPDPAFANLWLFYALGEQQYSVWGVIVILLAVTMNMSAVDSLQNALTATITANLFRDKSLSFTRGVVFLINIPLLVVGFFTLPALNLFLITNLLTTGSFIPLLSGLFDPERKYVSGYTMMFGSIMAAVALTGYGWWLQGAFGAGFEWAWWSNGYDIWAFVVPLVASIIALIVWTVGALIAERVFGIKGQGYTDEMRAVLDRMQEVDESQATLALAGQSGKEENEEEKVR
ncbi:hypothetical protein BCR44DRAFT_27234 [Catenaria anguillulae PL171]|uniref:Sodium:solute symporter family-domain-containing protein n=1 Tax=Catenaria anguillulae PL171 TaxID=765915 RepID=A0A1Y2HRC7_9FUNG|nr:hypothetical protein BCR44DRAFT_27234 [Catenaria anguillulae PL171]